VLRLQILALECFPTASADALDCSQMSLVHVASVPIPPYDLRTQGTLHFFLPDLHKAGLGTKLLVECLPLRVHVILRGDIAERIVSTAGGAEEQACRRK
jgi:hypothetical protein